MDRKKCLIIRILVLLTLTFVTFSASANRRGPWHRGDIRYFEYHDHGVWRKGHWRHSLHHGHMGWWWVVGPSWYSYSRPIYPYPDPYKPSVVVVEKTQKQAPQVITVLNWYYCEAAKEYYPYISTCPTGWKVVPATPATIGPK